MRLVSPLALVLVVTVSTVLASTSVFGAQWNDYHWPSNNTDLGITNIASGEYDVAAAVADWNQAASGTDLSLAVNGGPDIQIRSKNMSAWYLGTAEILVDTSTDHILSGRVTLNHRYLREGNLYGFDASVRQHVLCQELGHVLGLDHQHGDSCMNDDNATLGDYTEPNQEDEQTLDDMYGSGQHNDGEPTTDNTRGGPPCSKNPSHPNCIPQGAVWITVHVLPSPVR